MNLRLDRKEYIVPCMYTLAQRLAKVQKSARGGRCHSSRWSLRCSLQNRRLLCIKENLDCYRGEKAKYRLEAWTRYPESVPYTGDSINGWPTENS